MSFIILAGGRSSRLGEDKCSLILAGEGLLQRVIKPLEQLGDEIILVLSPGQLEPPPLLRAKVKIAFDLLPGKGPLIGIYSGLKASKDPRSLVVGCDMPFLNTGLLDYLIQLSPGFELVIPRIEDKVEPLHAVYSKTCLSAIEYLFQRGIFKVSALLDLVKVRYVEQNEIDKFDPEHLSFFNINTQSDLKKAEQIIKQEVFLSGLSRGSLR